MKPNRQAILIAIVATAIGGLALEAHARQRVAGKECAGMVSTQRNPQTGEVTRSCRTVDGTIATEPVPAKQTQRASKPRKTGDEDLEDLEVQRMKRQQNAR
jgi:hypothetical protein